MFQGPNNTLLHASNRHESQGVQSDVPGTKGKTRSFRQAQITTHKQTLCDTFREFLGVK